MNRIITQLNGLVAPLHEAVPARPRFWTWIIGAAGFIVAVIEIAFGLPGPVGGAVLAVTTTVAFVARRVFPALAVAVLGASSVGVDLVAGLNNRPVEIAAASALLALMTIYGVARYASVRHVGVVSVVAIVLVPAAEIANPGEATGLGWAAVGVFGNAAVIAAALVVRSAAANRRQRELTEEANQRNRLANDIHDSVAHHMSAIAIRAEAALQANAGTAAHEALTEIKKSASTGLADMRHLVNELRDYSDEARPLPGLGDIRQLASETTSTHLRVHVAIDADAQIVPIAVATAAYAVCREALTNVRRHATNASSATITVRDTGPMLELTVVDDGTTPLVPTQVGHGLTSMTQRAASIGGSLSAGPNPTGGWLVAARFPTDSGAIR